MMGKKGADRHSEREDETTKTSGKMDGSSPMDATSSDFLHNLRSSVSESHYQGGTEQGKGTSQQMTDEQMEPTSSPSSPPDIAQGFKPPSKKQVLLQDVLQAEPVEHSADTALMQSLEDEHSSSAQPHHRAIPTGTSTIMSTVPWNEEMAHEFEIEDLPPLATDDDIHDEDNDDRHQAEDGLTHQSSQRRPLLQRTDTSRRNVHHQRGQSVEQTLMDLTLALTEMHGSSASRGHRHRNHRHTASTADEFANNALRLHAQQEQAEGINTGPTSNTDGDHAPTTAVGGDLRSGRRLWDALLDGLPTLREQAQHEQAGENGASRSTSSGSIGGDGSAGATVAAAAAAATGATPDVEMGSAPTSPESTKSVAKPTSQQSKISSKTSQGNASQPKEKRKRGNHKANRKGVIRSDTVDSDRRGKPGINVDKFKEDWQVWTEFFRPRRKHMITYMKMLVMYMILPAVGVAAILYYFAENPPTGTLDDETAGTETGKASASYILLFCCRQLVTFSLAYATQIFLIDFVALSTRIMLNLLGPVLTLLVVQSKGWPFLLLWWSIYDFALLAGDYPFVHHWLFFQDTIGLFSENNPSGQLVDNVMYWRILTITTSVSIAVAVKRFLVGLYLGRATFSHYGEPLAKAMSKMLLVGEVASFAQDIARVAAVRGEGVTERIIVDNAAIHGLNFCRSIEEEENETVKSNRQAFENSVKGFYPANRDPLTDKLQYSEKIRLMQLLEQWEEPVQHDSRRENESASISAVLRFRRALTFMQKRYPFGKEFGSADTRVACIESAQEVYRRLMMATPGEECLSFETIAFLALEDDGTINEAKVKTLIKLFRPDRMGNLSLLDFCKSVDAIYKEFRFLRATIENSSQIDRAFEHIVNAGFYIIVFCIILSQLGFDPLSLFLSLSSIILAFAFMIGSASAKYFEGILFILVRRPYGIGDRIQVGGVETDTSLHGVLPWSVVNVTLFETTLVHLPTNERASLSNGSLANSRIVNWARSPQAQFHIFLQFPLNTPYQKLVLFKKAVEEYMRARPREWRALNGFRCNMVYAKENYMEYLIVIQHREAWQEVGQVLDSKANLTSYCQEVARQLDMEYQAPQVPVHLTQETDPSSVRSSTVADEVRFDENEMTHRFSDIAHTKHSIRVC